MMETELAWAAGLFEGEGTIYVHKSIRSYGAKPYAYVRADLLTTDHDVLTKFHSIVGGTFTVKPRTKRQPHHKLAWQWHIMGGKAERLLESFRPWLGERRQAQLDRVTLTAHEQVRRVYMRKAAIS